MLCGLLTPDSGEGTCLGYDIAATPTRSRRQVGYMTQRFSLYQDLSVRENPGIRGTNSMACAMPAGPPAT